MKMTDRTVGEMVTLSEYTGLLGYFGNSNRNYMTDRLVARAANRLGWDPAELYLWGNSKAGRWALDAECDSVTKFVQYMDGTNAYSIAELLTESGFDDGLSRDLTSYCEKYGCEIADEFPDLFTRPWNVSAG